MTPHDWIADEEENLKKPFGDKGLSWARCLRCGSSIVVRRDDPVSVWWQGWEDLYEDCLLTQAACVPDA